MCRCWRKANQSYSRQLCISKKSLTVTTDLKPLIKNIPICPGRQRHGCSSCGASEPPANAISWRQPVEGKLSRWDACLPVITHDRLTHTPRKHHPLRQDALLLTLGVWKQGCASQPLPHKPRAPRSDPGGAPRPPRVRLVSPLSPNHLRSHLPSPRPDRDLRTPNVSDCSNLSTEYFLSFSSVA